MEKIHRSALYQCLLKNRLYKLQVFIDIIGT